MISVGSGDTLGVAVPTGERPVAMIAPTPGGTLTQAEQGTVKVAVSGVSPQTVHTVTVAVKPGGRTVGFGGVGVAEHVAVTVYVFAWRPVGQNSEYTVV